MASETRSAPRRARLAVAAVAATLLATVASPAPTWSLVPASGTGVGTPVDDTSGPDDGTTEPTDPTEPTEPTDTTDTVPPSGTTTDPSTTADDDTTTTVTVLAVIGSLALLLVAVWWMLRRGEDERPPTDPDWPDGSEVI